MCVCTAYMSCVMSKGVGIPPVTLDSAHILSGLTSASAFIMCQMLCNQTGEEVAEASLSVFVLQWQHLIRAV